MSLSKSTRNLGGIAGVYTTASDAEIHEDDIDLRGKVVMPGFVDAHTHIFLHPYRNTDGCEPASAPPPSKCATSPPSSAQYGQLNHVREALLSGCTTYRDLGTEAMENLGANLRDCINRGLIPGPRLFVATHALAS